MGYEMNDKNTSVRDVCTQCVLKWFEAEKTPDKCSREVLYSIYFEGMIRTSH